MTAKILLAEDDTNLGYVISDYLIMQGYDVVLVADGVEAFQRFNLDTFHLCILDVMMPKKDGFSLAKDIRDVNKSVPILFLTAKSMTEDKVKGFNAGGDDYLTKPFDAVELGVRVKALLKRTAFNKEENEVESYSIGSYTFDILNFHLKGPDFDKKLTKKESQILKILCNNQNQIVTRELILKGVWGKDDYFVGRSLDVFITKLRKYFSNDPSVNIENSHGIGFKLEITAS